MVVVSTLNDNECWRSQGLLEPKFLAEYSDIEVVAGAVLFPAHRAILAAHSPFFRSSFESERSDRPDLSFTSQFDADTDTDTDTDGDAACFQYIRQPRRQFMLEVPACTDEALRAGWDVIYRYCYGVKVPLDTHAALAALQVAREYRFDELAIVLDAYLRGGGVNPAKCTEVFGAAVEASLKGAPHPGSADVGASVSSEGNNNNNSNECDVVEVVKAAAWRVMKERFSSVCDWKHVPYSYMVRLIKLNDLHVASEIEVWRAVAEWITACAAREDVAVVNGLVKLVRFPTMSRDEVTEVKASPVLAMYPGVTRFVARRRTQSDNSTAAHGYYTLLDCSPVFRRRRMDALTFSDKIPAWSTLTKAVHTSTRYFAGALWRIVLDPTEQGVGLYLSVISEESNGPVDVAFDFAVFLVHHDTDPKGHNVLVRKQANNVRFTRSGQRAGFANIVARAHLEHKDCPLVRNDTLCIGASIRLRGKNKSCTDTTTTTGPAKAKDAVPGISAGADDTAEMVSF